MQAGKNGVESAEQTGKSPMESAKETMANIAASAKSGMEKTKAVIEEKVERIKASDPVVEKDVATLRKEDKIRQAELQKQEAYSQNAAAAAGGGQSYTAAGTIGPIPSSEQVGSHTTTESNTSTGTGTGTFAGQTRTGPEP